jgi:hypothetical protein
MSLFDTHFTLVKGLFHLGQNIFSHWSRTLITKVKRVISSLFLFVFILSLWVKSIMGGYYGASNKVLFAGLSWLLL